VGLELNADWEGRHKERSYQFVQGLNDLDAANSTTTTLDITARSKRDTTVGLTGRLGFEMLPWALTYLRFGVETSRDKLAISGQVNDETVPLVATFATAEGSRRTWRWVAGIGAELPLPVIAGLTLRAEYDYHAKGRRVDTSATGTPNFAIAAAPARTVAFSQAANLRPAEHSGKLALVYNFL